jgi:hypothetical protein
MSVLWGAVACCAIAQSAHAVIIATSRGLGADAEVRDHQPTTNFGISTELAVRILDNFPQGHASDGTDRFSALYLKFDLTGQTAPSDPQMLLRLTYRNTNITVNRVHDTTPGAANLAFRTGLAFYGLDRDNPGNNWSESTITYLNAPGMAGGGDFDNGTKDYDFVDPDGGGPLRAPLTPLGVALFPEVPPQNRLPVGGQLVFRSQALTNFIVTSLNAGKTSVTIVAGLVHDGKVPVTDWKNFNYLFNPKEQTTLNTDVGYDVDTTNPNNPLGSPWSAASNAEDASGFSPFSPQLHLPYIPGDADLDGDVDIADLGILASNWQLPGDLLHGDFDGNGTIDVNDLGLLASNWQAGVGSGQPLGEALAAVGLPGSSVPEPGTAALLLAACIAASSRWTRRRGESPASMKCSPCPER